MKPKVSMRRALSDRKLLGHVLQGPSWFGWRVLLIAAAGEKLTNEERAEFKRLTGRSREPGKRCRELVCIFGRRAGKTLFGSNDVPIPRICRYRRLDKLWAFRWRVVPPSWNPRRPNSQRREARRSSSHAADQI